jgi:hypothetical protein
MGMLEASPFPTLWDDKAKGFIFLMMWPQAIAEYPYRES